ELNEALRLDPKFAAAYAVRGTAPREKPIFQLLFGPGLAMSKTRQVVVAGASSRPFASVIRASAVAARRPTLRMRPSLRTVPVSSVIPLMKLILNSSVV